ncbi:sensor domain-containing phosphodiesterase [Ochrobactrum soli]|uniref:Diguanylate cyclase/phosphodiesterase domain 2 (EAL) n=2 Tax=Ochrobactrum TaxID=528 RepID=A0A2P9HKU9_9HYPH|nr:MULTISPECIES: sensor domain-containing phosphodiesterase [Brucella]WHT42975.1 sensor domain-containing phosphodiesterase [Ochrobactrum sp. SSR]MDX4075490.1 sensor domain-containing phosphodiesterase [Brucella sp. NBRC 113783]NNU63138.1 sensor domain-containing phosphodiesterase [[Ochrobactrum] soli]RLL75474.1 sensor domain-containing phosphodiesterase [[Ochrobactrum] soli]TNV13956.1 sensor domain-containing phosphodiesterase [[Ochrobactrum] teleogrylli]
MSGFSEKLFQNAARFLALIVFLAFSTVHASAIEPIKISKDDTALDLSRAVELLRNKGESVQVSTAPGPDGIVRRIEVQADQNSNASGDWAAFSIANPTDQQIDRLIVAPHFRLVGSGIIWPDLGSPRIASITPSEGFALDRQPSADADVFRITLNPGSVVTFVAELSSHNLPQLYLWEPEAYKDTVNSYTLYRGILLGISGLLALFLTILFVVKGTSLFPATAALAWAVLAYICVDFGFWNKLMEITPGNEQIWRAGTEVALAASLVIFLFAYLNLNRWHDHFSYGAVTWVLGLLALAGVAVFDPPIASGIARISLALTVVSGVAIIGYLAVKGYDRAVMLIPAWLLTLIWLLGAWMAVTGRLDNDIVQPALGGGLVLIVLLIGFTVMQHAFAGGALQQGLLSDMERQALAVIGAGDIVWDWDVPRDRVVTTPDIANQLGNSASSLQGPVRNWLPVMHSDDRDRFRSTLDAILENRRGRIGQIFRMRANDGHYHWYALRARPVIGSDGEVVRCVGTLVNVTEQKKAEERLLHDAVHDNLTGLPNRELFLDRLSNVMNMARGESNLHPTVFMIDIDRFKQVNDSLGMSAGDTILLTISRRLARLMKPQDTLSRLSSDQFGLLLASESDPGRIAAFAEALRQATRAPIAYAKREIVLTASVGLITWTKTATTAEDFVKDAELAMYQAKRFGGDRIEPFRPAFRAIGSDKLQLESDLRRALERDEISMAYQPIVKLEEGTIAGFEALMRWEHPRRGAISPSEFIPIAENSGLIVQLGLFAMQRAAEDLFAWQEQFPKLDLFVSVNLSSTQLIRQDLINDVRSVLSRIHLNPGSLKLELTESVLMENPEQSAHVLARLKTMGIGLSLDDFGTGYSSLAYLTRFPFDIIKIDRSFVKGDQPQKTTLLRSIVSMAHDLGLAVVTEGVESESDALQLRQMGCEYVQSFMFGQPTSREDATRMIKEQLEAAAA